MEDGDERFDGLQQSIEQFVETARQIGIMASDFQAGSQEVFNDRLNNLIENMRDIEKAKSLVQNVEVPLDIFQYIDQGQNPQLYTRDCLEKALTKNEEVKGKIDAYKNFKSVLSEELMKEFPDMMVRYHQFKRQQYPSGT